MVLPTLIKDFDKLKAVDSLDSLTTMNPAIRDQELTTCLLPFFPLFESDPGTRPLMRECLKRLHDLPKWAKPNQRNPSLPYMPQFVRLYDHMKKITEKAAAKQSKSREPKDAKAKKPEAKPEPKPEPKVESKPEPKVESKPEPKAEPKPEPAQPKQPLSDSKPQQQEMPDVPAKPPMERKDSRASESPMKLPVLERKSSEDGPVVHDRVKCDLCGMMPIIGNRYKCLKCYDYDLCQACEDSGRHPPAHPMLKMKVSVSGSQQHVRPGRPHFQRSPSQGQLQAPAKAQFVDDISIPDGSAYPVGSLLTKTWAVKNIGDAPWGMADGTELVFVGGLPPEKIVPVPTVAPGMVGQLSVLVRAPQDAKRYTGYFRLQNSKGRFGPRIWYDFVAERPAPQPQPEPSVPQPAQPAPQPAPEKPIQEAQPPQPAPVAPVDQAPVVPVPAPVVPVPALVPQPNEGKGVIVAKPKALEKTPAFKYAKELIELKAMGFKDEELNAYLLQNNGGNVQRVVEWILSHP